jgi:hypothetical protein
VLGKTGQRFDGDNTLQEDAMYPGLSEADCQVAGFRYRQLVSEGQHRQFIASVRPGPADTFSTSAKFRQHLGTFLVRAGERLQGLHSVTRHGFDTVATGERAAIA